MSTQTAASIALRPYQVQAVNAIVQEFKAGNRSTLLVLATGLGKALRDDQRVLTPDGWRPIGTLQAGDRVIGSSGCPVPVEGVYPQGERELFEVKVSDGASVVCDIDHLWTVRTKYDRHRSAGWRTITLREMLQHGISCNGGNRWELPSVAPVDSGNTEPLPLDPYLMGILLGDGGLSVPGRVLVTLEPGLADFFEPHIPKPAHLRFMKNEGKANTYIIGGPTGRGSNPVMAALRNAGLEGKTSHTKFIPPGYLMASPACRLALLRGLMDTDGHVSKDGHVEITLVSHQLASGVQDLVRGLGGSARMVLKKTSWTHKGVRKEGTAWRLSIKLMECPFSWKAPRWRPRTHYDASRRVVDVVPAGSGNATCIKVGAEDGLFVTEGYVLTHNTVVFSSLAARAKGRVLVLAHRDELIQQAHRKLSAAAPGKNVGIVKARVREWDRHIIVASVQSLTPRHFATMPGDISLVITDESHHAYAAGYQAIYQHLKAGEPGGPYHLGVTATPNRADGKGLASVFQSVAYEYGLFDAIEDGWLCKLKALRIRTGVNLQGVSTKHGDFAAGELEDAVNTANRNELCVKAWKQHAADRQTVCFTAGVKHAYDLAEAFRAEGVSAAALCGETPTEERRGLLSGLSSGAIRVLCNASVLTEGFDEPSLRCIMLAKPTKSESLYIQMVGRGTRLHPGKEDALILDLSDNAGRHRLVQLADLDGAEKAKRDGVIEIQEERGEGGGEAEEAPVGEGIHAEVVDLGRAGKREKEPKVVLLWDDDHDWYERASLPSGREFFILPACYIEHDTAGWGACGEAHDMLSYPCVRLPGTTSLIKLTKAGIDHSLAKAICEIRAQEIDEKPPAFWSLSASWRKKPASDAQRAYAERCEPGCSRRNAPLVLTAGEASDIITLYRARKRLQKQERKAVTA